MKTAPRAEQRRIVTFNHDVFGSANELVRRETTGIAAGEVNYVDRELCAQRINGMLHVDLPPSLIAAARHFTEYLVEAGSLDQFLAAQIAHRDQLAVARECEAAAGAERQHHFNAQTN